MLRVIKQYKRECVLKTQGNGGNKNFYSKVKKLAKTSAIALVITLSIIGIVLVIVGYKGLKFHITEPVDIEEALEDGFEKGTYVKGSFKLCLGQMAEYVTVNEDTNSEHTDAHFYMFIIPNEDYSEFVYVPLKISNDDVKLADEIVDQTEALISKFGGLDTSKLTKSYDFEGEIVEMDDEEEGFYKDGLEAIDPTGDCGVEYMVETTLYKVPLFVAFIAGVLFLLGAVFSFVLYSGNFPVSRVKEYIVKKNLSGREGYLENDYDNGSLLSNNVTMGKEYAYFASGLKVNMLAYEDIVWSYVDVVKSKNTVSYKINMILKNKEKKSISFNTKTQTDAACEIILASNIGVLVGNDREFKKLFKSDFDELVRRSEAKKRAAQMQSYEAEAKPQSFVDESQPF